MADVIVAFEGWSASPYGWGEQGWGVGYSNASAIGEVGTVGIAPNWQAVSDSQSPGWTPVPDTQTPAWATITDTQSPNWQQVAA